MAHKTIQQSYLQRSIAVLFIIVIVFFGAAAFGVTWVQLVKGEDYRALAEQSQLRDTEIPASRGVIYDTNMKTLAESASVWKIYINPNSIKNDAELLEKISERLVDILGITKESVLKKASNANYKYMVVKYKVELPEKTKIDELRSERVFPDDKERTQKYSEYIGVDTDIKRYYPFSTFASAVIGFTGTDDIGRSGIELKYNDILTGVPGRKLVAQDGYGEMPIEDYRYWYDAQQGSSLVLTIDEVIQRYLEKSLEQAYVDEKANAAYGIVMDVDTGGILAMASMGNYDLNNPHTIADSNTAEEIAAIEDDTERAKALTNAQYKQWRNCTISDTYEPGSVFKVITASAALEENVVSLSDSYTCTGSIKISDRTISCHKHEGHGTQNFTQGLMNSCNPFFITVGQKLGATKFYEYFEAFGFTEKTGIDLPAEAAPKAGVTYHALENIGVVELASTSFGQSIQVSPIQMITAVSAIANGGKLMQPYVVDKVLDSDNNVVSVTEPKVRRQVISASTASTVTGMMEQVVSNGTGKNGYVVGYRVAGKTGTSEKLGKEGKYVASFACFAPADDPQIAILIAIDEPSAGQIGGGMIAAPVCAAVMENSLVYLNVEPQYTEEEMSTLYISVPSVAGKTAKEAKSTLEDTGFNVKILGEGENVVRQIPSANQSISKGGVVILYTENEISKQMTVVPDLSGLTISQANKRAVAAGLNIRISGNSLKSSELVSYRQSLEVGQNVEYGQTITVYFKSNKDVVDADL